MTVNRRRMIQAYLALALAGSYTVPAFAHRLARTETEIRIEADGQLSIIHVYHLQDAQNALYKAGLIERPDLMSLQSRAKLALYTESSFALLENGQPVTLTLIGAEVQGDSIYVYQEGTTTADALSVDARMLRELIKGQSNSVNIIRNNRTVTLDFRGDDGPKPVA